MTYVHYQRQPAGVNQKFLLSDAPPQIDLMDFRESEDKEGIWAYFAGKPVQTYM